LAGGALLGVTPDSGENQPAQMTVNLSEYDNIRLLQRKITIARAEIESSGQGPLRDAAIVREAALAKDLACEIEAVGKRHPDDEVAQLLLDMSASAA